jgi:4-amino-4-deoxy-L-arabinose transferase
VLPSGPEHREVVLVLWLGAGLAFLTKGPPGLLPLAGLALFAYSERARRGTRHYWTVQALLLFAAVALAWFAKVVLDRPETMRYFLVDEVYHRMASSEFRRNAGWYGALVVYLPTLVLGTLPWTWPLLSRAGRAIAAPRSALAALGADAESRLLLCWLGVPLLVFFLARSRLPFYLLPLCAPLALLATRGLPARLPRWIAPGLALWLVLLLALRAGSAHWPSKDDDRVLAAELRRLDVARIDEVAFVDTNPHYGLGFYLDVEVERLSIGVRADARVQAESVEEEMRDSEGCRILLAENDTVPALEAEFARLAVAQLALGRVHGYQLYAAPAASCRPRG